MDRALIKNLVPENDYKFYVFSSSMDIIGNLGGHSLYSNMVTSSTAKAGSLARCEGDLKLRATPKDGLVHLEWNDISGASPCLYYVSYKRTESTDDWKNFPHTLESMY